MNTFPELDCSLGRGTEPWGHETVKLRERLSRKGNKNVRKVTAEVAFPTLPTLPTSISDQVG